MTKRTYQLFLGIGLGVSLIALFFNYQITIGVLVGMLASYISHILLVWYTTAMLKEKSGRGVAFGFFSIVRILTQFCAFFIFLLFPSYATIYSVLFGLILLKICIYVDDYLTRRGEVK